MNNPLKPLLAVAALAAATAAGAPVAQAADACPNAAIRSQQNTTNLPGCRAYEMVTPADKNGGDATNAFGASADGNRMAFYSAAAFSGIESNAADNSYVAQRGPGGWTTHPMQPKIGAPNLGLNGGYHFADFTDDLRESFTLTRSGANELNTQNIYVTQLDGSVSWLTAPTINGVTIDDKAYAGRSADGSHIIFESAQPFTNEISPGSGRQIWEWVNGHIRLVSYLPDGSASPGSTGVGVGINGAIGKGLGFAGLPQPTAVSEDGSKIFFGLGPDITSQVFVRINGTTTREISASQRTGSVGQSAATASFAGASADGNVAVFTSLELLTDDATPNGGLYAYDLRTSVLRFVSSGATNPNGAQIEQPGGVSLVSRDGSHIYFVAQSVLVPGKGVDGGHNLYVSGPDGLSFIATLGNEDAQNWNRGFSAANDFTTRATADGRYFVFQSWEQITSVDNHGHEEIYLYDADHGTISCVSCGGPGHTPAGDASIIANPLARGGFLGTSQVGHTRTLTDDGSRIFFQTTDALLSEDVNDVEDVYEYQTATGQVSLLSSGKGGFDSEIADNTPDGRDVYIITRDALVKRDTDGGAKDIYDARTDGGLADDPPGAAPCADDACQPIARAAPAPSGVLTGVPRGGGVKEQRAPRLLVRKITAAGRRTAVKTGRLTVVSSVEAPGTVRVTGTASYGDHIVRSLKSVSVTVKSAATRNLHLSLPDAVRAQLRRHHKVKLSLTVSYNKATGPVRVALTLS
jgi:hypothetical protein